LSTPGLETALRDNILTIRIARPEKMNAVSLGEMAALTTAFLNSYEDEAVRCVVLTGAGRAFCAGRDLADAQPDEDGEALLSQVINPMLMALHDHPKPTIAAVNGAAMGIGLGLALACDIVFAGESAVFSSPFAKLGGALDTGGHYYLPRRVGIGLVYEMVYTARRIGGAEAVRTGLADRLSPDAVLMSAVGHLAEQIAAGPQIAFRGQKAILRRLDDLSLADVLAEEARLQGSLASTPEYAEGVRAFREKRPADFRAASMQGTKR
jgi:2-(1,2-epoxy-1,2-dihydrophenyl)acetyl-CoA isomerase